VKISGLDSKTTRGDAENELVQLQRVYRPGNVDHFGPDGQAVADFPLPLPGHRVERFKLGRVEAEQVSHM